jgi:hypothetical protein
VHRQREASGQASKDEKNGAWTILRYVDLVCHDEMTVTDLQLYSLFISDDAAAPAGAHETIPGAWPDQIDPGKQRHSGLIASSTQPATEKGDAPPQQEEPGRGTQGKVKSKTMETKTDKPPSPSHRSPRQVISDIVHPNRSDIRQEEDTPSSIAGVSRRPTPDKHAPVVMAKQEARKLQPEGRSLRSDAKPEKDSSTLPSSGSSKAKPAKEPSARSKTTETRDTRTRTALPDITVEPYHSKTPKTHPKEQTPHKPRSSAPLSSHGPSPQSSPSQYSQDDDEVPPEGTVSSDEDARSLLAQADSGPVRVAPLNIRNRTSGDR